MTRVCFVGNSHLAAVKLGWDATSNEFPDLNASFFGAPAAGMSAMAPARGGYLVSRRANVTTILQVLWGTDRFRPDDYDVICCVGMGMSPRLLARLYWSFRSSAHRNRTGNFRLLSSECFQEAANGRLAESVGGKFLMQLREVSQRPVVIAAQAAPCLIPDEEERTRLERMLECGDDQLIFDSFVEAVGQFPGANFLVPQPETSRLNLVTTRPEYAEGSQRLEPSFSEHEDDDRHHMNAAYGALVLRNVYELIRREGLRAHAPDIPSAGTAREHPIGRSIPARAPPFHRRVARSVVLLARSTVMAVRSFWAK
jgi:hypothetical protein